MDDIIASRGFVNDNDEEFDLFVESKNKELFLIINHYSIKGEREIRLAISPEVLEEIQIMCRAALNQINEKTNEDSHTYTNWK
jgi:hypothetical protein